MDETDRPVTEPPGEGGRIDEKQAKNWSMACHLLGLIVWVGIPFGNVIGPLVLWLLKREEHPMIDRHGKEALNFQISMTIYAIISALLIIVVLGVVLLLVVAAMQLILTIIAAVKASNGEFYRYPLTIRLVK